MNATIFGWSIIAALSVAALSLCYALEVAQFTKRIEVEKVLRIEVHKEGKNLTELNRDKFFATVTSLIFVAGVVLMAFFNQTGWLNISFSVAEFNFGKESLLLLIALLLHDCFMYFSHRWLHSDFLYKNVHSLHHESKVRTAWTALSVHPLEAAIYTLGIIAIVMTLPMHILTLVLFISFVTIWGLVSHVGKGTQEQLKGLFGLERFLIGSYYHDLHHRKYTKNYGMYFVIWDGILGTLVDN